MASSSTQEAIVSYLADFAEDNSSEVSLMPEYLRLPLRERYARLERYPELATEWANAYENWCNTADSQYRCFASKRQVEAPWFRLGVKDTVDVAGLPTSLGLHHYRHYPEVSAKALTRIDPHIAITCKVASTELNIGFGAGCYNPRFPDIDPSGSSTGSAVSVAANLCDISLGTDVLGSVRWPASHCGMVGLRMTHKPTNLQGVFPLSPRMDALGWITRTADDLEFLFPMLGIEALLGEQLPVKDKYQIGFLTHAYDTDLTSKQMIEMLSRAWSALDQLGMNLSDVSMPDLWKHRGNAWQLCAHDAWLASAEWDKTFDSELHWSTCSALDVGKSVSDAEYQNIVRCMDIVRSEIDEWFTKTNVDFVAFPIDPNRPFDRRRPQPGDSTIPSPKNNDYLTRVGFTPLASFSGLPAITLPISLSTDGKAPLALQIMGRRDSEKQLINISKRLENLIDPLSADY